MMDIHLIPAVYLCTSGIELKLGDKLLINNLIFALNYYSQSMID